MNPLLNTAHPHLTHPQYRADIDGLRALAVLSVVGYHAFPGWVKGGFVGVDMFFVISGFLISTIIFGSLEKDAFSFKKFYARRIKRIFPALILVLATSYAVGWFVLLPDEYEQLGKHIAAGAGFVSNLFFWQEAGYFDNAAEAKPMLHLWSLGIEEQFYIIWPLFIYLTWKRRFSLLLLTVSLAAISFAFNVSQVHGDAVQAFYSPVSRFWELMAGSILAYLSLHKVNLWNGTTQKIDTAPASSNASTPNSSALHNIQSVIGILLVGIAVLIVNRDQAFPGWWALLPTLGAYLVISAGPYAWLNRTVLSHRVMVWFGLVSYPLYLWHWPLLSFAHIVESGTPAREIRIVAIIIAIALAWLTYNLIEKPVRFGRERKATIIMLCVLAATVGLVGYYTNLQQGLGFRDVAKLNSTAFYDRTKLDKSFMVKGCGIRKTEDQDKVANCISDKRGSAKFALVGDSKAAALAVGLFMESSDQGRWIFIGGNGPKGATVPVLSDEQIYSSFQSPAKTALEAIVGNPDIQVVVLTVATRSLFLLSNDYSIADLPANKNFDVAFAGLDRMIAELVKAGKKVVITVDNPTLKDPKLCIPRITALNFINKTMQLGRARTCSISYDQHLELSAQYRLLLERLQEKYPDHLSVFDTLDQLCDMKNRLCSTFLDGRILYKFSDHISQYASVRIAKKLIPFVEDFAQKSVMPLTP
jgi:peptidoglycan/LPS O-acetylase OafA/YrhL